MARATSIRLVRRCAIAASACWRWIVSCNSRLAAASSFLRSISHRFHGQSLDPLFSLALFRRLVEIQDPNFEGCQQVPLLFLAAFRCRRPRHHAGCLCLLFHYLRAVCPGGHRLRYGLPASAVIRFKAAECSALHMPHARSAAFYLPLLVNFISLALRLASVFECGLRRYLLNQHRVVSFSFACLLVI